MLIFQTPAKQMSEFVQTQPTAPSPKASSFATTASYLTFSSASAETLTPESGAGGRPSRVSVASAMASAVGTATPGSRLPSAPEPAQRLQRDSKVNVQNSSTDTLSEIDDSSRTSGQPVRTVRQRPGEFRRRKYSAPGDKLVCKALGARHREESSTSSVTLSRLRTPEPSRQQSLARQCSGYPRSVSSSELDDSEVLIEGPLQQRAFLVLWRQRWCVLHRQEFRVYRDEEASLLAPEKPLEQHLVANICVASDLHFPSLLVCQNVTTGEPLLFLRTGPGLRWEEVAASSLWLRAFAAASRSASFGRSRSGGGIQATCAATVRASGSADSGHP